MARSRIARARSQPGLLAATAVIAATGAVALAGVAGAAEETDFDVYGKDAGGLLCFSTAAASEPCAVDEVAELAIVTGDTVTWTFVGNQPHNVASSNEVAADPSWTAWERPENTYVPSGSFTRQFTQPGEYEFVCEVHPQMRGTVTVTGEPVEPTATATATATSTPTAEPTTQPGGGGDDDDHMNTPAPTGGAADTTEPRLDRVRARAVRRGVRVRFRLSEPATVQIRVKRRRGKTVRTKRVQAPAGMNRVKVRSTRIKRRRFVVQLRARDSLGNRSSPVRDSFRGRW